MKQELEQEILVSHKRETRLQTFGMLLGIAIGVFVAMNVIDVVKSVFKVITKMQLKTIEYNFMYCMTCKHDYFSTAIVCILAHCCNTGNYVFLFGTTFILWI